MCWYFSKLLNIFEIEWNRFPTGFICQPAEYVCVRVCVCESFPVIQSENKWSQFRARLEPQTRAETNPQSSKWRKCGFGYGFSLFSARQPHNPPTFPPKSLKACLCFSLCVCVCVFVVVFFLWKFPKTFRRHFVYFTSRRFSAVSLCLCGTNRGEEERENRALRRGIKVCLEYHLVCFLHCGSSFLASIRSWCSLLVVGLPLVVAAVVVAVSVCCLFYHYYWQFLLSGANLFSLVLPKFVALIQLSVSVCANLW